MIPCRTRPEIRANLVTERPMFFVYDADSGVATLHETKNECIATMEGLLTYGLELRRQERHTEFQNSFWGKMEVLGEIETFEDDEGNEVCEVTKPKP